MAELEADKKKEAVCVTGANGFIGSWLVRTLVEHGYTTIHASIFPGSDASHLFSLPGAAAADIVVYEADLLDAEAVARAVEGCTGVFHVASPCSLEDPKDPEKELLMPAVEGTKNVLEAARRFQVRRVVLTSSISALVPNPSWPPNIPFNETSWTDLHYCKSRQVFSFSSLLRWIILQKIVFLNFLPEITKQVLIMRLIKVGEANLIKLNECVKG